MRRSMLKRTTAFTLCLFLLVNLAAPAAWPGQPRFESEIPPQEPVTGLALEYQYTPSTGLNDALELLLADLAIYEEKQHEAGTRTILPAQIEKRWAEIRAHHERVRRQLDRDAQRLGASGKRERLGRIRAELDKQMAWYKEKIDVFLNTRNKAAARRQAADAIGARIRGLRAKPLPEPTAPAMRAPGRERARNCSSHPARNCWISPTASTAIRSRSTATSGTNWTTNRTPA